MCGRFTLRTPSHILLPQYSLNDEVDFLPRYNIAPTQSVVAIRRSRASEERQLAMLKWGLVPFWAKDPSIGNRMINARAETVASKPSFRIPFRRRRCLILADGYYEWQKTNRGNKQPYYIRMKEDRPFTFAGLWESWGDQKKQQSGLAWETCTIITTYANQMTRPIHDRMPVILDPSDHGLWLDPDILDVARLEPLLTPFDSKAMVAGPVSTRVNRPTMDDPRCIEITPGE